MTPEEVQALISSANRAMANAQPQYSGFRVGAALLSGDGRTFTGCNIENPSLTLCACAERVAVYKAISEGATEFRAIAIVSGDGNYCYPCGSCRQLLQEFAPAAAVFLSSEGVVKEYGLAELLPHPFEKGG